jgi:CheY-like chemotaxis protein
MDINMPVMDGITCCRRIKQDPDIASIPVVMVTTAGSAEDVEICRQAGCNDYITKPIDRRLFLDMGRKYLPPVDRREPRIPAKGSVNFSIDGRSVQGEVVDLSIGGAYIASVTCLRQEDRVTLTLTLNDEEPRTIKARGRVAWENRGGIPSKAHLPEGFGVEFLDLDALSRELLIQYVEARKPS